MSVSRSVGTTRNVESTQPGVGGSEDDATSTSGLRKIVAASMAGTIVEWYEFFLYATASILIPSAHRLACRSPHG